MTGTVIVIKRIFKMTTMLVEQSRLYCPIVLDSLISQTFRIRATGVIDRGAREVTMILVALIAVMIGTTAKGMMALIVAMIRKAAKAILRDVTKLTMALS
jgi:hypothetical protein